MNAEQIADRQATLESFKGRLQKILKRKRAPRKIGITINVPREEISAFLSVCQSQSFALRHKRSFWSIRSQQELKFRLDIELRKRRRGRPKLTDEDRAKRLSKNYHICEQQRKRIRKSEKIAARMNAWSLGLRERGETILTDTVGPPDI
ncbi:MAG: hypothetical protein ACU0GG_12105 [Paracoccaceae bacterium]